MVRERQTLVLTVGSSYTFPYGKLHETLAKGLTASVIQKTFVSNEVPNVMCNIKWEPDNNFNRYAHSPESLWNVIESIPNLDELLKPFIG